MNHQAKKNKAETEAARKRIREIEERINQIEAQMPSVHR